MPGVYEKQCRGPRFDYMVSAVENCKVQMSKKNYVASYEIISEILFSLCNDCELIEEFFYSGAFKCCCELLSIKGINEMSSGTNNVLVDQEMEVPRLIIEQFSLLSTFTIQSFDEEIGEISLLVYFLTERHRYYVDINWKSHELEYISIFLKSHFQFLYCAIKSFNRFQTNEGPSLLLMTLKNIEIVIRSFPGHRIVPNMVKILTENSTWDVLTFLSKEITSSIEDMALDGKDNDRSSHILQFRECAIVLTQIVAHFPIIGVNKGLNKYIIPSLTQIGLQKLLLSQSNGDVYIRCSCKYCENCRKIQKICTKKDEFTIQETIPLFHNLFDSFIKNDALGILINLLTTLQKTEGFSMLNENDFSKKFGYKKTYVIMIQYLIKVLDFYDLMRVTISLMKMLPKYTKFNLEDLKIHNSSKPIDLCFSKISILDIADDNVCSNAKILEKSEGILEVVSLSENAKLIITCITSIILHKFNFPINRNTTDLLQVSEIICPTFELLIKKLIIEWEKKLEELKKVAFSFNQLITVLSEANVFLTLLVPIYIKYLFKNEDTDTSKINNSFNFIRKGISSILNFFVDLFQTFCRMNITEPAQNHSDENSSKVNVSFDVNKDIIYNIGSSLIFCLSIISDTSTYNWTCTSRRRYIASPHFEICGWIASSQYKLMDFWKQIFSSDRCICIKELSQIVTLVSERSSGLNSRNKILGSNLYLNKEFLDQCETYFEETDDEINIDSDENIMNEIE